MKFNKIIILLAGFLLAGAVYFIFRPKEIRFKTEAVKLGDIVQDVSETGSVKKGEAVNLNFNNSGQVTNVYVSEGDEVAAGQILADLDVRQLQVQLSQAHANLDLYSLELEKLKKGVIGEEIDIVESQKQAAQSSLASAEQSLFDAKTNADQKLSSVYKTGVDTLSAAYTKAYNAYNFLDLLQRTYFVPQDDDSIVVWETLQRMNLEVLQIGKDTSAAQSANQNSGMDAILDDTKKQLAKIENELRIVRVICEKKPWRESVAQSYKDNLDLHIGYVVTVQATLNSAIEDIALQKSANDLVVNNAQASVDLAKAALKTAGEQFKKTTAVPRSEDVGILQAQIKQANAQIELLELQIGDSHIKAPVAGQISKINIETGETVSPSATAAIVLLPLTPYEVQADIYEEEAAKIKIGDMTTIEIAAVSEDKFSGKVVWIAPAGKLINGVVYYETRIAFDEVPQAIKPDMTADVTIITASKTGVLLVSETVLQKKDGGYFVQVLKGGVPQDVPVEVGIRSKGVAEIVSGLSEGDEVVIP